MGIAKNKNSKRSILFRERNDLKYCEKHVRDLLDVLFKIKHYEIKNYKENVLALFIYDIDITYVCYYDENFVEVKLRSSKDDYKSYKNFVHNDCFKKAIQEIIRDCGE